MDTELYNFCDPAVRLLPRWCVHIMAYPQVILACYPTDEEIRKNDGVVPKKANKKMLQELSFYAVTFPKKLPGAATCDVCDITAILTCVCICSYGEVLVEAH